MDPWMGSFAVVYSLVIIGCGVGFILFVIAHWRMMKAHEVLADSLYEISEDLKTGRLRASQQPEGPVE